MSDISPRSRLHHAIRREFATAIAEYYRQFPERLADPNLQEGTKALLKLLENVLAAVDSVEITDR